MKWVFCFYTKTPCLSYTILQANHNKYLTHKLKQNRNFPTSFNLYTKGRLKQKIQTAFNHIGRLFKPSCQCRDTRQQQCI